MNPRALILRDIVNSVNEDDCPVKYSFLSKALHDLDRMGENDLENMKIGYVKGTLTKKEVELMRWHIAKCNACYEDVKLKSMLSAAFQTERGGVEALLIKAEAYKKAANYTAAIKYYQEALELRPGDKETKRKMIEISEMKHDPVDTIPLKLKSPVERLSELKSRMNFSFSVVPLFAVREEHQEEEGFKVGEEIVLEFEPSREKDGYLTIIHYDELENVEIVFPRRIDDVSLLRADDDKSIRMLANEPRGKHYIKALLTPKPIIEQGTPDFMIEFSSSSLIEHLLESLYNLSDGEWMEAVVEFEIK